MNERDAVQDLECLSFYDCDIAAAKRRGDLVSEYYIDAVQMAKDWINEARRLREALQRIADCSPKREECDPSIPDAPYIVMAKAMKVIAHQTISATNEREAGNEG